MQPPADRWAENGKVRIHYLQSGLAAPGVAPLVLVPGVAGWADDYAWAMDELAPRKCVALTLRGRGKSDTPQRGYSLADHIGDIEAVVLEMELGRFCLYGHSRSVSYVVQFALLHSELVAGLVLADYPAVHTKLPEGWPAWFLGTSYLGKPVSERMRPEAVRALQQESEPVSLWERLGSISCPVLVMRGALEGSLLKPADVDEYRRKLQDVTVATFNGAGHNVWEPDSTRFTATLREFLDRIDALEAQIRSSTEVGTRE